VRKATRNHLTHLILGGVKANEPAFGQRIIIIIITIIIIIIIKIAFAYIMVAMWPFKVVLESHLIADERQMSDT